MTVELTSDGADIVIQGEDYQKVLQEVHRRAKPRTYFEIGSLYGDTLRLAECTAIAVDPAFQLKADVLERNPKARVFEQTSDDFFAAHDLKRLFGRPVDFAFLDGMHEFSFLLRDFINTERHCRAGSIIALHDCLPGDAHMTRPYSALHEDAPTNFPDWWTGDVWKMVPVLREVRPDLQITCLDAPPTGLVAITGLDPHSTILETQYNALIAQWSDLSLHDWGMERLLKAADPVSSKAWVEALEPFDFWTRTALKFSGRSSSSPPAPAGAQAY